jgi:hypothetical protein
MHVYHAVPTDRVYIVSLSCTVISHSGWQLDERILSKCFLPGDGSKLDI